jgi:CRP-like cAMP-binding protein
MIPVIDANTILGVLDKTALFRDIPHSLLNPILKQSLQISLKKGERLLSKGEINEHVYIITSGALSVHLTPASLDDPIAKLYPGDCVGEMSVLVDGNVSAYVTAIVDSQVLAIGYSTFWGLIKGSNDAALNMLNILVQRIRKGNEIKIESILLGEKINLTKLE